MICGAVGKYVDEKAAAIQESYLHAAGSKVGNQFGLAVLGHEPRGVGNTPGRKGKGWTSVKK